jgi:hypothetical protein
MESEDLLISEFKQFKITENIVLQHSALVIQKHVRGFLFRLKRLPLILYLIQNFLVSKVEFNRQNSDGRINSCYDETKVVDLLKRKYGDKIVVTEDRHWYDILLYDTIVGWIPVNIKSTTTTTSDNTGNLAMCVYAYTNSDSNELDIFTKKTYKNGPMSELLIKKLKKKEYNRIHKKDYYFIVLNKSDPTQIIINSVKGLSILTPNSNNLPFQVCWGKNSCFNYKPIDNCIKMFIDCLKKPKPSWQVNFIQDIKKI